MNNHTTFAVQPLWSNKAFDVTGNGCVRSAPTNPHAMPPVGITPPAIDICMTTASLSARASLPASRCRSTWPISGEGPGDSQDLFRVLGMGDAVHSITRRRAIRRAIRTEPGR